MDKEHTPYILSLDAADTGGNGLSLQGKEEFLVSSCTPMLQDERPVQDAGDLWLAGMGLGGPSQAKEQAGKCRPLAMK